MKRFFVIVFSILVFGTVSAQNTADIGIWGGVGSYTGDMTHVDNASSLNPNVGLFFRYNFNSRIGLRTSAILGTIGAEGEYEGKPWDFNKFVTDVSVMGEFNFFRYIIGSKRYSWTTYLLGGVGGSIYPYNFDPVELQGVGAYVDPDGENYTVIGLNVPVGFGFKFNVGERMGIGVEAVLRKYFNDKMDDLDDPRKFNNPATTNPDGQGYNDFLHNNDFTIHFGVHLTYRFFQGNRECPVYENVN
jgi:hypothetical protein